MAPTSVQLHCPHTHRRPAVIVSYVFSGVAAVVAACCFAELSQEFPVAGGAFSYVMVRCQRA